MESLANEADRRKRMKTGVSSQDVSSSPPSQAFGADERPQPKRVACTNCRQSKLRCDSPKNPCSRCARLGLTCNTDTGYKRVSKRSKIDELEEHVQQLRAVIDQTANSNSASPPVLNVSDSTSRGPVAPLIQPPLPTSLGIVRSTINMPSTRPPVLDQQVIMPSVSAHSTMSLARTVETHISRPPAIKARAIDSTALEREQIDTLFLIYFQNFHQFFPLLDPRRSADEYFESSPLLFWSIIATAARRYAADPGLLGLVAPPIRDLAWKRVADPPLTLAEMQGLLLLVMWPANTMRMWTDASMTFCNLVVSSAMHMGLHRPNYASDFQKIPRLNVSEAEITERMNTWCACNVAMQLMTLSYGYPPVGSCFDWSIEAACEPSNPYNLPDTMRFMTLTQRFSNRVMKVMSGNLADSRGMPSENEQFLLLDILENDLDALANQWGKNLSPIELVYFHTVRMYLHVFYWLGDQAVDQQKTGILKSYATAASVITYFTSADSSINMTAYAPMWLLLVTLSSTHLISKVLNSSFSQYIDVETGNSIVESGLELIRRFSVSEGDLPLRAHKLVSEHWIHRNDNPAEKMDPPVLAIKSRLGASMCYDCLFKWRHYSIKQRAQNGKDGDGGAGVVPTADTNGAVCGMPTQPAPDLLAMNWDTYDDFNWGWDFDIPMFPPTMALNQ